jgi:hypothetical protein
MMLSDTAQSSVLIKELIVAHPVKKLSSQAHILSKTNLLHTETAQ